MTSSESSSTGFSRLDIPGVQRIEDEGRARFDLRDHAVTREDVGLGEGRLGPVVGSASAPQLDLQLVGPDGTEGARTSTFTVAFNGPDPQADAVTWFEAYDTDEEGDAALTDAVTSRGLPADQPAAWRASAAAGMEKSTLKAGVSPAGLVTEVTVRAREGGGQIQQWSVLLRDSLYTPQALAEVRRTGQVPLD